MEATPEQLPALLDRFQLAVTYRTGAPAKKARKAKPGENPRPSMRDIAMVGGTELDS